MRQPSATVDQARHHGELTVRIRAGSHRFHRDLPPSMIWGYDGSVPGPTIDTERGQPVTVEWRNELEGPLPVVVTIAPQADADGVPVQCLPGLTHCGKPMSEVLAAMSQQATYMGEPREAVDLARGARTLAEREGLSALVAEASVMEAHGQARAGKVRSRCVLACTAS